MEHKKMYEEIYVYEEILLFTIWCEYNELIINFYFIIIKYEIKYIKQV